MEIDIQKLEKFKLGYYKYQIDLIEAIDKALDKINPKDKMQAAFGSSLFGYAIGLAYKIDTLRKTLKELFDYELPLPPKNLEKYFNQPFDIYTLNNEGKLFTTSGLEVDEILKKINEHTKDSV